MSHCNETPISVYTITNNPDCTTINRELCDVLGNGSSLVSVSDSASAKEIKKQHSTTLLNRSDLSFVKKVEKTEGFTLVFHYQNTLFKILTRNAIFLVLRFSN